VYPMARPAGEMSVLLQRGLADFLALDGGGAFGEVEGDAGIEWH